MIEKIHEMWPEITLFIATCVVMVMGLSKQASVRALCAPLSVAALVIAGLVAWKTTPGADAPGGGGGGALVNLPLFGKVLAAAIGVVLVLLLSGTPDREYEAKVARGATYEPLRATRAEFYSFVLFSLTGLMLAAGADDLIMLFLALELTSLPTYVMVTISTARNRSMEAGVKYFFLGALGAATFLYGFALIYGGTGTTNLADIRMALASQSAGGGINTIAMAGVVLAFIGMCFKIAAVPMHFYTPDVYQGASASMSGFLAFVPKAAGFFGILLLVSAVGWTGNATHPAGLPEPLHAIIWVVAVATMTIGNVLAVVQRSVKRILAYSSIAHSGYMLVGVLAGPGLAAASGGLMSSGVAATLFYLLSYGVMNLGAFAVLACLERTNRDGTLEEADDIEDIRGLCHTRPVLGWTMVLCSMSLLGLPPLLGFWAKLPLFAAGISAGEISLVVILGVNSAIAAYYYLRLAAYSLLEAPEKTGPAADLRPTPFMARVLAGVLSAAGVLVLVAWPLTGAATAAGKYVGPQNVKPMVEKRAELKAGVQKVVSRE